MEKNRGVPELAACALDDEQLDKVSGGIGVPVFPGSGKPGGINPGQALEKPSCFSKSEDRLPSGNGH